MWSLLSTFIKQPGRGGRCEMARGSLPCRYLRCTIHLTFEGTDLDPLYFDKQENKISRAGKIVQITPKAAAVLACLLDNKGDIVSKDYILEHVWQGLYVTEDLVREYIFDLRTAIGDDAKKPDYIETVRGKGFRLIGEVIDAALGGADRIESISGAGDPKPNLAVLRPIVRGDLGEVGDRFAEAVIAGLVAHKYVEIVSRQSSFAVDPTRDLSDVATDLNAQYLLESSLACLDDRTQVTVHLIDGQSDHHIWADRFELQDSGAVETVAAKVVNAVSGWQGELHLAAYRLVARKPARSLSAFEHFIRGCDLELNFDAESVKRSLAHFDSSLALDPNFARCLVMKSIMLQWSFDVYAEKDSEILKASAAAMAKAYVLNPRDPLTLALMTLQRAREGDMAGAFEGLEHAAQTCQGDADACVCVATSLCVIAGDFARAREMFEWALAVNPLPPGWYRFVEARIRFYFGEYERSVAASHSGPQRVSAVIYRCLSYVMLDDQDAARAAYRELLARYPGFAFEFYADYFPISAKGARAQYDEAVQKLLSMLG